MNTNDPIETAQRLKVLLPKVTTDKVAFNDAAELVIDMSLNQLSHGDLIEFYYETQMDRFRADPTNLQMDGEYFIDLFDDPEFDDEIIIPFKD
jgi:hypothetical protein